TAVGEHFAPYRAPGPVSTKFVLMVRPWRIKGRTNNGRLEIPRVETAPDPGLLGLRSDARVERRPGAARWHRPDLSGPAGRGDVFPHAAPSRLRRRRNAAVVLRE